MAFSNPKKGKAFQFAELKALGDQDVLRSGRLVVKSMQQLKSAIDTLKTDLKCLQECSVQSPTSALPKTRFRIETKKKLVNVLKTQIDGGLSLLKQRCPSYMYDGFCERYKVASLYRKQNAGDAEKTQILVNTTASEVGPAQGEDAGKLKNANSSTGNVNKTSQENVNRIGSSTFKPPQQFERKTTVGSTAAELQTVNRHTGPTQMNNKANPPSKSPFMRDKASARKEHLSSNLSQRSPHPLPLQQPRQPLPPQQPRQPLPPQQPRQPLPPQQPRQPLPPQQPRQPLPPQQPRPALPPQQPRSSLPPQQPRKPLPPQRPPQPLPPQQQYTPSENPDTSVLDAIEALDDSAVLRVAKTVAKLHERLVCAKQLYLSQVREDDAGPQTLGVGPSAKLMQLQQQINELRGKIIKGTTLLGQKLPPDLLDRFSKRYGPDVEPWSLTGNLLGSDCTAPTPARTVSATSELKAGSSDRHAQPECTMVTNRFDGKRIPSLKGTGASSSNAESAVFSSQLESSKNLVAPTDANPNQNDKAEATVTEEGLLPPDLILRRNLIMNVLNTTGVTDETRKIFEDEIDGVLRSAKTPLGREIDENPSASSRVLGNREPLDPLQELMFKQNLAMALQGGSHSEIQSDPLTMTSAPRSGIQSDHHVFASNRRKNTDANSLWNWDRRTGPDRPARPNDVADSSQSIPSHLDRSTRNDDYSSAKRPRMPDSRTNASSPGPKRIRRDSRVRRHNRARHLDGHSGDLRNAPPDTDPSESTRLTAERRNADDQIPERRNAYDQIPESRNADDQRPERRNADDQRPERRNADDQRSGRSRYDSYRARLGFPNPRGWGYGQRLSTEHTFKPFPPRKRQEIHGLPSLDEMLGKW